MKSIQIPTSPRGWRALARKYEAAAKVVSPWAEPSPEAAAKAQAVVDAVQAIVRGQLAAKPVELNVGAYATYEFESPRFATVTLDPEFFEQLDRLSAVARANDLTYACVAGWPLWDEWEEISVDCEQLKVSKDDWHYGGYQKHVGYGIDTHSLGIVDTYLLAIDGIVSGEPVEHEMPEADDDESEEG